MFSSPQEETELKWLQLATGYVRDDDIKAKFFIDEYDNIEIHAENLVTPLHHAVSKGNSKVVAQLTCIEESNDHNVDVNSQDINGNTPLHIASRQGNAIIVRMLLDCGGVNTYLVNKEGLTSLQEAQRSRKAIVVALLLYYIGHQNPSKKHKEYNRQGSSSSDSGMVEEDENEEMHPKELINNRVLARFIHYSKAERGYVRQASMRDF